MLYWGAILVVALLLTFRPVQGFLFHPKLTFQSHSLYSNLIRVPQQQPQQDLRLCAQKSKSIPKSKKVPEFTVDETDDVDAEEFISYESNPSERVEDPDFASVSIPMEPDVSNVPGSGPETVAASPGGKVKVQYAAMEPGTVLQIQIGDMARARKAWKKRRRSDSPLLVPCSILHVDRFATLRWNCIYLLEKFGASVDGSGIRISLSELSMRHRTHLKSSLLHHALELGFPNSHELLDALFHKQVQDAYGVRLVTKSSPGEMEISVDGDDELLKEEDATPPQMWLETPLSRTRAQSRSAKAAILQFCEPSETVDILQHTGYARIKRDPKAVAADSSAQSNNMYQLQPLSVALRVGSEDLDHLVSNGSRHAAVVFDYDVQGDAGVAPLLTLSLNPQRNQVRDRLKQKQKMQRFSTSARGSNGNADEEIRWFHDLKVGEGPYSGKVLRLIKGGALVECGIRRHRRQRNVADGEDASTSQLDQSLPVFGFLRFKDAVISNDSIEGTSQMSAAIDLEDDMDEEDDEDWNSVFTIDNLNTFEDDDEGDEVFESDEEDDMRMENDDDDDDLEEEEDFDGEVLAAFNLENDDTFEEGEDITHLFELRDDGTLEYTDPETGVTQIISDVVIDDRHDDDDEVFDGDDEGEDNDSEDDGPVFLSSLDSSNRSTKLSSVSAYKTQTLHVGDRIDVYIKSVSKQSSQLLLSMDSSIRGKKAKDLKKEGEVSRKLSRLVKQLGGYKQIRALKGVVCQGVVQATSNSGRGEWFYVQPEAAASLTKLPVGIATVPESSRIRKEDLKVGDTVQIQINGIDEDRGQLALTIVDGIMP